MKSSWLKSSGHTAIGHKSIGQKAIRRKFLFFEEFWAGRGPFPILFTQPHLAKGQNYTQYTLVEQHRDVDKLLADALLQAESALEQTDSGAEITDDGIPTIRADLGTTLLPSALGLEIEVQPNQHPWLKNHLTAESYLGLPSPLQKKDIQSGEIPLASTFYRNFLQDRTAGKIRNALQPYVPDTQGIFDLSHLILGTDLLLLIADQPEIVHRIQNKSLELFLAATRLFKNQLGEQDTAMVHGHGMARGVWFPDTGARLSEDSCTLISEQMIRSFCLPYIRQALSPFGRGFLHFCGYHEGFLHLVGDMPEISTLNLGNPELYDLDELFALAGRTDTVYFGHIEPLEGENGENYLERLADLCGRQGARLILVSGYTPRDSEEMRYLTDRWHRLTKPRPKSSLAPPPPFSSPAPSL